MSRHGRVCDPSDWRVVSSADSLRKLSSSRVPEHQLPAGVVRSYDKVLVVAEARLRTMSRMAMSVVVQQRSLRAQVPQHYRIVATCTQQVPLILAERNTGDLLQTHTQFVTSIQKM